MTDTVRDMLLASSESTRPQSESEMGAGKLRKYNVATELGRAALSELRPRLAEQVGEALPENKPHAPARTRHRRTSR